MEVEPQLWGLPNHSCELLSTWDDLPSMLCDTRGLRCFLVALNHVIFDPQSQSSIPQSIDQTHDAHLGVFCMKKHIHANTAGRKVETTEKKGYPDQYYMHPTFVFFDTLYKANDSNSYI